MKKHFVSLGIVVSLSTLACDAEQDGDSGTLAVRLSSVGQSGALYRLENAELTITGREAVTLNPEPELDVLEHDLIIGSYYMILEDGWNMVRSEDGTTFEPVEAELVSSAGMGFSIVANDVTSRGYRFWVEGGELDFARGTLEACIEVDEVPVWQLGATFETGDRVYYPGSSTYSGVYEARRSHTALTDSDSPRSSTSNWQRLFHLTDCPDGE